MADSDKDILITPNVGVATNLPEIKFVGKDNSPMYLKVLDDNALSFEGTEGQVFSMSPTMSSGDIFSVSDISGVQSMAVNADGTIKIIPSGTTPSSNLYLGDLRHCFVYARGTGNNNAANSLIYLNGKKIIDNNVRGMYLTILNQIDLSVVSSTRYDTYSGGTTNVNNLATAIGNMTDQQIGILVSEDAWEPNSSNGTNLWAAAKLVGLTKLGHYDGGDGSVRRPYAAIFMGSGDDANAANKFVIERMSDADADAPMASVSAILVSDGVHASISGAQYQNALWSSDSNHEEPALIVDEDKHVGINTVTPVRPLHVTGDAYVQNGDILLSRGNYYLQDASDATKRGSFSSDGVWAWENVNVGIGTTSPNAKLHVSGDTYIQSATANQLLRIHADTNSSPAPRIEMMRGTHDTWGSGDNYCDWRIVNENNLTYYSGFSGQSSGAAVERLKLYSDATGLEINNAYIIPGSAGTSGQVLKWPSSGTTLEWADQSGGGGGSVDADANLASNPRWTMTDTSGIGLEIYSNQTGSNMDQDLVRIRMDSQYADQAVLRVIHDGVDQMNAADHSKICGALWVQSIGDTTHQWPMTVANTINANQDGYGVGIKLKLSGVGNQDESKKWSGIGARGDDGSTYGRPTGIMFWTKTDGGNTTTPSETMYLTGPGSLGIGITAPTHIIHVNGQGRATNSAWATSSDMRVKENIIELDGTLDTINSLRPVKFDYIDGKKEQVNFIAQEFKEVIPDAVTLTEEQGLDDFHVLDTSMLVPMLVKAVQELTVKVEQLEARLDG